MVTAKSTATVKQITYLAGALKAPRITEVRSRMADQARDAGWPFEEYLAAVLEREVSARNAEEVPFPALRMSRARGNPRTRGVGSGRDNESRSQRSRGARAFTVTVENSAGGIMLQPE